MRSLFSDYDFAFPRNKQLSLHIAPPLFCAGCGRKRSAAPISDNTVDGFRGAPPSFSADSRAELDELARHVLAQARLWEQLQHKVTKREPPFVLRATASTNIFHLIQNEHFSCFWLCVLIKLT